MLPIRPFELAACAGFCILVGAMFGYSSAVSNQSVYTGNIAQTIGHVRCAKDIAEATASIAKGSLTSEKEKEVAALYATALAWHNYAATDISISLGSDGGLDTNRLATLLQSADAANKQFRDSYCKIASRGERDESENSKFENCAGGFTIAVDVLQVVVELAKLQHAKESEQRTELRTQLDECKWRQWHEIGSTAR
jgi:hypothetical protein